MSTLFRRVGTGAVALLAVIVIPDVTYGQERPAIEPRLVIDWSRTAVALSTPQPNRVWRLKPEFSASSTTSSGISNRGRSRLRGVLIGAAIGAGVGVTAGLVAAEMQGDAPADFAMFVLGSAGAGIGAITGLVLSW